MCSVLIIGSGGREHAITWKISQSDAVKHIFVAPGSHAIQQVAKVQTVQLNVKNHEDVTKFCKENNVSLVIVGPEDPLANGIADSLNAANIKVFGPQKIAAQIESNKDWAKAFMDRHGIPTAKWKSFNTSTEAKQFIKNADFAALVVKASGLAAGKGVVVAADKNEACSAVDEILTDRKYGNAGETVVIEELLTGEEVSLLAFCDGNTVKPMLPAQDHKRIFDNDLGPNTGGMGAYCPCPLLDSKALELVYEQVLQKTVDGFKKEGIKFVGVLYAGLMVTKSGPKVLEFNCRFGDPETEVILPLLTSDLYKIMLSCCEGTLGKQEIKWKENVSAVGVVMASRGYPETSSKGQIITKLESLKDILVFHCGTSYSNNNYQTNGGRVLINVALAPNLVHAATKATKACEIVQFDGAQFRHDISHKGIARSILQTGKLSYKESGVDITAGNDLITFIKPSVATTKRSGVLSDLGGFGGLFSTKLAGYKDPILVSGTDGVGTKLKIAHEMGLHSTIGIDLVAMCVNDVLANAAEPLFFLDYFACGSLDVNVAKEVVKGIAAGCKQANCALIGGETAEMPDMYAVGDYDLAGFTVGAVESTEVIPKNVKNGDIVIGLPSTGVHSNGFSLVRKVLKIAGMSFHDKVPFSEKPIGEVLLEPTRIYVNAVIPACRSGKVNAFAHITGGGLVENIPRVLPDSLAVRVDAQLWKIPPIFAYLAAIGGVNETELLRTFNCGLGGVLIVPPQHESAVLASIPLEYNARRIGVVENKVSSQVVIENFTDVMEHEMRPFIPQLTNLRPKKRVGVLISGSGTNLQALIDTQASTCTEIVLVLSNKADVEGLNRAKRSNIPTCVLNHKEYNSRVEFDNAMNEKLLEHDVEIVCLAGFMRILSAEFTKRWNGQLINVHPALLPSFKGTHAQKQALDAGVTVSGCTVHFVNENVDDGAIITQEAVPVRAGDTEEILIERIKEAEHTAFPRALQLLATGKCRLGADNKIVWTV